MIKEAFGAAEKFVAWCAFAYIRLAATSYGRGEKQKMKVLKAIMIVAVLASALSLGACAQKKEETTTATTTAASTHTYSK
jgi:hypothetical protein